MAGLQKYFKPTVPSKEFAGISAVAIKEANVVVQEVLKESKWPGKRKYQHFTLNYRTRIGKYAAENSNASAVRKFTAGFEGLRESTVRLAK